MFLEMASRATSGSGADEPASWSRAVTAQGLSLPVSVLDSLLGTLILQAKERGGAVATWGYKKKNQGVQGILPTEETQLSYQVVSAQLLTETQGITAETGEGLWENMQNHFRYVKSTL